MSLAMTRILFRQRVIPRLTKLEGRPASGCDGRHRPNVFIASGKDEVSVAVRNHERPDADFGRELIASMQEAAAIVRGEKDAARVHLPHGGIDVRAIRERLGLTRPAFAQRFGLAVEPVRNSVCGA
jgi:DNA-binding transcriptional regulator YiaG